MSLMIIMWERERKRMQKRRSMMLRRVQKG